MKTLIVFATKYGGTKSSAEKIAAEMNGAELCQLGKTAVPDLEQFDCIIVGGPVFAGSIHKAVAVFANDNVDVLLRKKLGLFIAGLENSERESAFTGKFPEALITHASAKEMIGGICDPKTLSFFPKMLMRAITKTSKYHSTVSDEKIKKLAAALANAKN